LDFGFLICIKNPRATNYYPFTGRGETEQTTNNVPYRQKGARRYPLDLTDEKTAVGITTMQGESSTTDIAEDHQSLSWPTLQAPVTLMNLLNL
jgi:hypothetical protein